jgi:hypothetical protein
MRLDEVQELRWNRITTESDVVRVTAAPAETNHLFAETPMDNLVWLIHLQHTRHQIGMLGRDRGLRMICFEKSNFDFDDGETFGPCCRTIRR